VAGRSCEGLAQICEQRALGVAGAPCRERATSRSISRPHFAQPQLRADVDVGYGDAAPRRMSRGVPRASRCKRSRIGVRPMRSCRRAPPPTRFHPAPVAA